MLSNFLKIAALVISLSYMEGQAQSFFKLDNGTNAPILSLHSDTTNNILYVGGQFSSCGNLSCYAIAKWNGVNWDSTKNQLLYPPFDQVRSIQVLNNQIYIGGSFGLLDNLGSYSSANIAKWDSNNLSWVAATPFTPNSPIASLSNQNNHLIVTGTFDSIGGIYSPKIAFFDGNVFTTLPILDTVNGGWSIQSSIYYNGNLYVGGNFVGANSNYLKDIAMWDGFQWNPVGNGLSGTNTIVRCFTQYQGKLIVGGYFLTQFGDPGNGIAAWDGATWSQLGSGLQFPGEVKALCVYKNDLWVGGIFNSAGSIPVTYIAKWNGSQWQNVSLSLDNQVTSMSVYNNNLYIGGAFIMCNGDTVNNIIRYNDVTGINNLNTSEDLIKICPNPVNNILNLQINSSLKNQSDFTLYNSLGKKILKIKIEQNSKDIKIDVSNLPASAYFWDLFSENKLPQQGKVIITK